MSDGGDFKGVRLACELEGILTTDSSIGVFSPFFTSSTSFSDMATLIGILRKVGRERGDDKLLCAAGREPQDGLVRPEPPEYLSCCCARLRRANASAMEEEESGVVELSVVSVVTAGPAAAGTQSMGSAASRSGEGGAVSVSVVSAEAVVVEDDVEAKNEEEESVGESNGLPS